MLAILERGCSFDLQKRTHAKLGEVPSERSRSSAQAGGAKRCGGPEHRACCWCSVLSAIYVRGGRQLRANVAVEASLQLTSVRATSMRSKFAMTARTPSAIYPGDRDAADRVV